MNQKREREKEGEGGCTGSLLKFHTKREMVMGGRGIQFNPVELGGPPQNINPLHSLAPLEAGIERRLTPPPLVLNRRSERIHIRFKFGLFPLLKPVVEMGIKQFDQLSDRQGRIAFDRLRQKRMIERDVDPGVRWCAFDDGVILMSTDVSFGAVCGDGGGVRVSRHVVMEFGKSWPRVGRHKGVDRWIGDNWAGRIAAAREVEDRG